jgi:hypothetical protein
MNVKKFKIGLFLTLFAATTVFSLSSFVTDDESGGKKYDCVIVKDNGQQIAVECRDSGTKCSGITDCIVR